MAKNLVIVESPAKAKTIEKFLGKDFKVASSYGHIADLPSKELGVDVKGDFSPKYRVSKDKKSIVKSLKPFSLKPRESPPQPANKSIILKLLIYLLC